jgi:hypothetical protein
MLFFAIVSGLSGFREGDRANYFQGAISSVAYLIGMIASIINLQQWDVDKSGVDFGVQTNNSVYGDIYGKKVLAYATESATILLLSESFLRIQGGFWWER